MTRVRSAVALLGIAACSGTSTQVTSAPADLVWAANPEPDLDGYEVVWRETTESDWTHAIPVGNVTSASLPHFSKDNVFFGVRAVDKTGHYSRWRSRFRGSVHASTTRRR